MQKKGMLIVISGPSGSGKGTVVKQLDNYEQYALSISMTTRKPRPGEEHGKDYFFCEREEFQEIRDEGGLLEHAEFVGNMYGTPKSYVMEQINLNKVVILEIDVIGALQVKELFPECVLIFLMPPTKQILRERLIGRNTEERGVIERRLKKADEEIELIPKYDYLIINDLVDEAVNKINAIVGAERLIPIRNIDIIENFKGDEEYVRTIIHRINGSIK